MLYWYLSTMKVSNILQWDAFSKTEEDVRIRTNTGAIITIGCILTTLWLIIQEWNQLSEVVIRPQLYVDRDSDSHLELNIDNLRCHIRPDQFFVVNTDTDFKGLKILIINIIGRYCFLFLILIQH